MSRLVRDPAGYFRSLQMSAKSIWIFAEGTLDRAVYGSICAKCKWMDGHGYEIATSKEVQHGPGEGKTHLVSFFQYLSANGRLEDHSFGKSTICIFFLDKDVDDICDRKLSSSHVCYSEWYSVENYLFTEGDIVSAVCCAAHIDHQSVVRHIDVPSKTWASRAALAWREWVLLCMFSQKYSIRCANYSVGHSPFNYPPYSLPNSDSVSQHWNDVYMRSGMSPAAFDQARNHVELLLDNAHSTSRLDIFFNGKWYKHFLADDANQIAGGRPYNSTRLAERLIDVLLGSIRYDDAWAARYHEAIGYAAGRVRVGY